AWVRRRVQVPIPVDAPEAIEGEARQPQKPRGPQERITFRIASAHCEVPLDRPRSLRVEPHQFSEDPPRIRRGGGVERAQICVRLAGELPHRRQGRSLLEGTAPVAEGEEPPLAQLELTPQQWREPKDEMVLGADPPEGS